MSKLKKILLLFLIISVLCPLMGVSQRQQIIAEDRRLPVIMYHQVMKNRKSDYIVTPKQFENDLIELKKRGYETVFPSEIVHFIEHGGRFPEKPILITFDDGHYNNIHYCGDILKKHGSKAVINIIGRFSEFSSVSGDHSNPNYSHITWEQIREICGGAFEIGNHSYNMHNFKPRYGIAPLLGESNSEYKAALLSDVMRLQAKLQVECGITPLCFAYPFGKYNDTAQALLTKELGFKLLLTCTEKVSTITSGKQESLYRLGRFNRWPNLSSKEFFDKLEPKSDKIPK